MIATSVPNGETDRSGFARSRRMRIGGDLVRRFGHPVASITGAPKACSNSAIKSGESGAEQNG